MLEERRQPYTPQQIRLMFPVLTEVECLMVAHMEERFPRWHVWPHVDYPQTHLWLARRNSTSMNVLVTSRLADMPGRSRTGSTRTPARGRCCHDAVLLHLSRAG